MPELTSGGAGTSNSAPATTNGEPNERLGFEVEPTNGLWSFIPEFQPEEVTVMKKQELSRYGGGCDGESVSIKSVKNREVHATGLMLRDDIRQFHSIVDHQDTVDVITPKLPNGGLECYLKKGELGKEAGWDPVSGQRVFEYTLDFVSTGLDEYESGQNRIVTEIMDYDSTNDSGAGGGPEIEK